MLVVTQVAGDGSMRRRMLDTSRLGDPRRWDDVIGQLLVAPLPYRPLPGGSVYHLRAGDHAVLIADFDLLGPLRDLVMTVLTEGERC
jgi:hypothetical protein